MARLSLPRCRSYTSPSCCTCSSSRLRLPTSTALACGRWRPSTLASRSSTRACLHAARLGMPMGRCSIRAPPRRRGFCSRRCSSAPFPSGSRRSRRARSSTCGCCVHRHKPRRRSSPHCCSALVRHPRCCSASPSSRSRASDGCSRMPLWRSRPKGYPRRRPSCSLRRSSTTASRSFCSRSSRRGCSKAAPPLKRQRVRSSCVPTRQPSSRSGRARRPQRRSSMGATCSGCSPSLTFSSTPLAGESPKRSQAALVRARSRPCCALFPSRPCPRYFRAG
mmetsp:Transcript_26018/g.60741  ORF Transcript_26018/g.60741 Transcript_26018/m.60741 type:complete len:278 (-) Transcript_26018:535-1368(-)